MSASRGAANHAHLALCGRLEAVDGRHGAGAACLARTGTAPAGTTIRFGGEGDKQTVAYLLKLCNVREDTLEGTALQWSRLNPQKNMNLGSNASKLEFGFLRAAQAEDGLIGVLHR